MEPQKRAALEELASELGKLEDDAFHLDQGHISYLIARARTEIQALIVDAHRNGRLPPAEPMEMAAHQEA